MLMLGTIIIRLVNVIGSALVTLMQFLTAMVLGIIAMILIALPWLLRAASILIWLFGAFVGIQAIQTIYSPTTSSIPLFALQFAVIILMVAWALFAFLLEGNQLWGILTAGGITTWACSHGALWLANHWKYADLFFGIFPTSIFITTYFYMAVRTRALKQQPIHTDIQPVSP